MGKIELVFGSMFSGKTEELLRRLRRCEIAGQKTILFKPEADYRYGNRVKTHDGEKDVLARPVINSEDLLKSIPDETRIIGIDEVQFFDEAVVEAIVQLAATGRRVICAGLDMWANGKPIEITGKLACVADEITKLQAVCTNCGRDAYLSHKKAGGVGIVEIGGGEKYTVLCRKCLAGR